MDNFLEDKIISAEEAVSFLKARIKQEENEDISNIYQEVIDFIYTHSYKK